MKRIKPPFLLILARENSKRIPNKILQEIGGETLLARAIKTVRSITWPVWVSSDSAKILSIAAYLGAKPIPRPAVYATDTASSVDAAIHACAFSLNFKGTIILVQVTSPFTQAKDIIGAYEKHQKTGKAIFAAKEMSTIFWGWSSSQPLFPEYLECRSQDLPLGFLPAGNFFVTSIESLKEHRSFFLPAALPFGVKNALDIDTPQDLEYARWQAQQ